MKAGAYISAAVGLVALITVGLNIYDNILTDAEASDLIAREAEVRERGDLQNQLDRSRDRLAFLNTKAAPTVDDDDEKQFLRQQIARIQERLEKL